MKSHHFHSWERRSELITPVQKLLEANQFVWWWSDKWPNASSSSTQDLTRGLIDFPPTLHCLVNNIQDFLWELAIKSFWYISWSKLFLLQNFMNLDGTILVLSFLSPPLVAGPQKPQKLTTSKIKYKYFGPKILILHWKMQFSKNILPQKSLLF